MQSSTTSTHAFHNFVTYPESSSTILLDRLCTISSELAALYGEIAMIEAENVRERAAILQTSGETSSNGRRDRVNMQVVEGPATVIELTAQRDALVEEKWLICRILDSRR